jgi:hypothetical protein
MLQYLSFDMSETNEIDVVSMMAGATEAAACCGAVDFPKINMPTGTKTATQTTAMMTTMTRIQKRALLRVFAGGNLTFI